MSKWKVILVIGAVLIATPALAVAIDDTITPQSCDRTNPACAQFLETTSRGQIKWGGLVAGGLRSLTNMFVDGKLGVATLRPSTGEQVLRVDVEGAVGAKFYCDENGNHCVRGDSLNQGGGTTTANVIINNGLGINVTHNAINNFTIGIDDTVTQRRVTGVCPDGNAVKQVNQDGTVVCQAVGGIGSTFTTISSGPSLTVNHGSTTNSYVLTVNPDVVQFRLKNACPVGQAIRDISANGTPVCEPILAGSVTNITSGPSLVVNRSTTTNAFILTVNPDVVQFRVTNTCPVGQAIRGISANGTLTCQAVTTTGGDQLWLESVGGGSIYNKNLGNTVGIGMNNPGGATLLVSQRTNAAAGEPIATFRNVANTFGALIGLNGGGIDAYSRGAGASALYGHVDGAGSSALVGISLGAGETYGAKISGSKVGTFAKGNIGLYATDMSNASVQSGVGRDNRIPADLAASGKQWAGYFDGDVNIDGTLNINGNVTVNGQPLAGANTYKLGEYCGAFTYDKSWGSNGKNANIPCLGKYLFKNQSGIPSSDSGMDNVNNFSCPAKFSLIGGDFQSSGNRYFYACVRSEN